MEIIKNISRQADLIRNKPVIYTVGEDEIKIYPLTVDQVIAINPHLSKIEVEGDASTAEEFREKVAANFEMFAKEIKAVINEVTDYKGDLLPIDYANLLMIIQMQMDTANFINAITSAKRLSRNKAVDLMALNEQTSSTR